MSKPRPILLFGSALQVPSSPVGPPPGPPSCCSASFLYFPNNQQGDWLRPHVTPPPPRLTISEHLRMFEGLEEDPDEGVPDGGEPR